MGNVVRLLAFLFLAAFAVATLAPAAEAAAMAVEMADSGGCDGCPGDDGDSSLCDQACVTSLPALPAAFVVTVPAAAKHVEAGTSRSPVGWTGAPDPSPPKVLLLS